MTHRIIDSPQKLTLDQPVERLDVHLVAGRLNVIGADGPTRVEVTRISRAPLVVEHRDGHLSVRHQRIRRWPGLWWWLGQLGRRFRAEVSLAVPPDARVQLRLISGPVIASGLRATTDVEVTSGQVTLLGLRGRTRAKLVSGPVEALGGDGELTLETISGELIVADSAAERVHATTVSGAITCDVDNPRDSEIQLGTTSGGITVRVREDSDLTVDLKTTSGRITSAFTQLDTAESVSWSKSSRGVLGRGTGRLRAASTSGSIALLARPVADEPTDSEPTDEPVNAEPARNREAGA
ncbi:MAG TPA: DUF4097 family beta strand repeat-containing protein [Micromonospora sp.]|nr:DUF4097 family beta strand repeat-containing protein [Micromonospora sp.]